MKHLYFYEINHSKFYGYIFNAYSVNEFSDKFELIKKNHKRATHFVYAYKINENNEFIFKRDDDVEPKGYATNSMVNIIEKNNLNNIAIVVVRYFGGKKLGGGKLVQSYNKTINESFKLFNNK